MLSGFSSLCSGHQESEYVSIITCTSLNFPNSAMLVTNICHEWLGSRPQGLTSRWCTGKYCEHISHCLIIWQTASLVNLNGFLKFILFWWCRSCDSWASSTRDTAIVFVRLSTAAGHSANGLGILECILLWPTKHGNLQCCMAFWICWTSILTCLLLAPI